MENYFATLPVAEIGPEIFKRIDSFYEYLRTSGRLTLYKRCYDYYYQSVKSGGRVYQTGAQGEYTNVDLADFRNILLHLKVMTTNQKPQFEPKATNSDHESLSQTILASGLLEYYLREKKLDRYTDLAMEYALRFAEGYVELDWNATAGADYVSDDSGKTVKEGDLEAWAYGPIDVPVDFTRTSSLGHDWRMTRRFVNKWNIAEKYAPKPKGKESKDKNRELRERILSTSIQETEKEFMFGAPRYEDTDMIAMFTMHHSRTDAVPDGRMTRLVAPDAILTDGELPFKNVTLYRLAAGDQDGTPFGYTVAFDLLPLQQVINSLLSTISTNASAFGVQNIAAPKGHGLAVSQIIEGLNLLEYDGKDAPQALNLLSIPAELFKFLDQIRSYMEVVAGLTSVSRGTPEASLKSGAALALVQSMAIQFNSGLQQSYAALNEDMGTGIIEILQDYATTKRVATIAGKANRSLMREWTGPKDLSEISRVTVDLGNPLSRTTAGRVNMAEALLGAQMIENPQQYLQVLQTGRLEPMIEGKTSELLNIKSENERIGEGDAPEVVMTDNHALHVQEHKVVMDSPESRENPQVVESWTSHIQQHFDVWAQTPPELLQVLGLQPIQPQMPPEGGSPAGGQPLPPEASGVAGQAPPTGQIEAVLQAPPQAGPQPKLPSQPTNPLTGEKFNQDTGGLPG